MTSFFASSRSSGSSGSSARSLEAAGRSGGAGLPRSTRAARAGRRPRGGAWLVLAAAGLWGTTGTTASLAPEGASALSIGAATMGIGGLLTLALAGRSVRPVLQRATLGWALAGAAAVVCYPLAFYTAMAWAGVAVGTVVSVGSAPVFAALLERCCEGLSLSRRWWGATLAAGLGCVLLTLAGDGGTPSGQRPAAGVALGVLAGVAYAGYTYCASRVIRRGHPARATMGALFGLGALVLLPVLAVTGGPLLGSARGLAVVGYLAVVPMCLAYLLFGAGLVRVRTSAATTLSLFEPLVAAVLAVLVVDERLDAWGWFGVALVALGLTALTARGSVGPRR
ncbi:EamA family transporter [Streptomyces sp. 3MP-14]|uniref:EamA family transporter n=1 Tax=Streptomyces mimosae TaxID=2586635 RepID=A0A5N6A2H0_9ACTN|nr:EamA family transporter [Streptomyces mimosae]KAB8179192.1 EamA family transporter [Streptomyces sp. 3MP-14]